MAKAMAHRGPDDAGLFEDHQASIGLAHVRLSILDLSPMGHQPMISDDGRVVLVFNGEIYNHAELRRAFEASGHGVEWNGHSDTETLLRGFEVWGIKETLARAVGMFAFALYDQSKRQLFLARDRMGEKPLYYGISQGVFLFGSELKALRKQRKLSLAEAARIVSVSARTWARWEKAERPPPGAVELFEIKTRGSAC